VIEQNVLLDSRIDLRDEVPQDEIPELIRRHDAVVSPSLWECGPNTALEALSCNRPVLATPVGGHCEIAVEGQSGMLADGTSEADIFKLMERAIEQRGELREMVASGGPVQRFREIADTQAALSRYDAMLAAPAPREINDRAAERPLVSILIPYYRLSKFIEATVKSACAQTYEPIEVLIVNDGSFEPDDEILERLAEQYPIRVLTTLNQGLTAARNFGVRQTSGRYLLMLDADNIVEPEFVERAVEVLEHDDAITYVTSWFRCIDSDGDLRDDPVASHPLSNRGAMIQRSNVAGDALALMRRSTFEAGYWFDELLLGFEDWSLYRNLGAGGLSGHVMPDYLFRYRVRGDSKLRGLALPSADLLLAEMDASDRSQGMQWTPS
jgi:hypothetical protein